MSDDYEVIEPENFMESRRYRIQFCCERCGHTWKRTFRSLPKNDPPCPDKSCEVKQQLAETQRQLQNMQRMLLEQRPPGHIGENVQVKAIDATADIVMTDYKMTNLQDNIRHGDAVAPKLPFAQQQKADNFFGGDGSAKIPDFGRPGTVRSVTAQQMNRIGQRAIRGSYRHMAVTPQVLYPNGVQSGAAALHKVRDEPTGKK